MGQSKPFRPLALIVENDPSQRELLALLLEESELDVVQCESAEDALQLFGGAVAHRLVVMVTDVELGGRMNGAELAFLARRRYPELHIIVTSGASLPGPLPERAHFLPKPWRALDILREAERSIVQ